MLKYAIFGIAALGLGFAGCTQSVACPDYVVLGPVTNLAYPVAGAMGIADNVGVLIFSGSARQKIRLVPSAAGAVPVTTQPTSLPSPLPSPIAAPVGTSYGYYAVSIPTLARVTTYEAEGQTTEMFGCGGTSSEFLGDGSFTTQ